MSGVDRLVDVSDGSPVSNGCSSPLSPDCSAILDTPLSLDFDPMSFQFQEVPNPADAPSNDDDRNSEPIIIKSANYTNQTLDVFDPLVTSDLSDHSATSDLDLLPPSDLVSSTVTLVDVELESEPIDFPELTMSPTHSNKPVSSEPDLVPSELDLVPKSVPVQELFDRELVLLEAHSGPDILDNPSVCNPNPDLVLIDGNFGSGDDPHQNSDKSESPPSEDYTTSSSEMIDPLDSTNDDNHVVECMESASVTSSSSCVVVESVLRKSVALDESHEDAFETHEDLLSSDSDSDSRSKHEIKKRVTATKKVISTESTVLEHDKTRQAKEVVTKQSTQVEEKTVQMSTRKGETRSYKVETNSKMNGKFDTDSSEDEIESPKIECPISVSKLNGSLPNIENNVEPDLIHSPQKEVIVAVDLKRLRSQYVMHAEQELATSPPKEIVLTGIDIASLKNSYSSNSQGDDSSKEVISTGVDIKQLKTSFSKPVDEVENYISAPVEEVKPSVDRAQVARKFSQEANSQNASQDEHEARGTEDDKSICKICDKHVYQMEKIKAEKNVFHKNCFRCKECQKSLTVDAYSSHEGEIFCKPHFKMLFQPKARFEGDDSAPNEKLDAESEESEEGKQRRNEMVIRENVPEELPPDVVRCETRSNDLESLPNLNLSNIKSRFELPQEDLKFPSTSDVCSLQRSPSIMARLAKYQSAVSNEGHTNGELSSGEDEPDRDIAVFATDAKANKEKVYFSGMSDLKTQWESGNVNSRDEDKEEVKDELSKLRQRMNLGRSESMKAVYEKACQESKSPVRTESVVLGRDIKALSIKDKFEKGVIENDEEIVAEKEERLRKEKEEDLSVLVEPGTALGARSLFQQMDASIKSPSPPMLSPTRSSSTAIRGRNDSVSEGDIVKCSPPVTKEDVNVDTTQVTEKFKFFQNFKEEQKEKKRFTITPPRDPVKESSPDVDIPRDPNIIRSGESEDMPVTDTAKRMLDKFKAMESEAKELAIPTTPKPLKRITPPRDDGPKVKPVFSTEDSQPDPDIVRCSYKSDDDIVVEVDKAKSLRAKFENWETEVSRENMKNEKMSTNGVEEEDYLPQVDTTKNLKAKFEAIKDETSQLIEKPKPKVSRFIQEHHQNELCKICEKRLYPLEKMEASGMKFHKNCFRCAHCNCVLRLENFTTSSGKLFCTPHFKQLFKSKGNYDEGFGREQHKEKWNRSRSSTPTPRENGESYTNGHHEEMV